jgi:hypothetical protein
MLLYIVVQKGNRGANHNEVEWQGYTTGQSTRYSNQGSLSQVPEQYNAQQPESPASTACIYPAQPHKSEKAGEGFYYQSGDFIFHF